MLCITKESYPRRREKHNEGYQENKWDEHKLETRREEKTLEMDL